jgi:hypothetical protein
VETHVLKDMNTHVPEVETYILEDMITHIPEVETHDQRVNSLNFWEKPTQIFSINTNLPSGIL